MKKGILFIFFNFLLISVGYSQLAVAQSNPAITTTSKVNKGDHLKVFPNPATQYIQLNNAKDVDHIVIYNVVGRRMKSYKVTEGKKYDINSLPVGMYLVQLVDHNKKVITTQRLSKR
ncbi:MAG: T9SS type A sorting domain-containing protein [Bacteroidota bacterium]